MSFLDKLKKESNYTQTENGAVTYKSTYSACLDLFYMSGAMRNAHETAIDDTVRKAFAENRDFAMKIIFFARDIRGGLGERRFFRTAMRTVTDIDVESVRKNLKYIAEYGRWDDLTSLYDIKDLKPDIVNIIKNQLEEDTENMNNNKEVSLLAKWLPSVNTSSEETRILARSIAKDLGLDERTYRKKLSALRKYIDILETRLCNKDYTFDYSKQPSKAMLKYRKAFIRNDNERYSAFLDSVIDGEQTLNTSTLYPYEIVNSVLNNRELLSKEDKKSLDVTWNAMNDIENAQNAIAVVDGSGSMYWSGATPRPVDVAVSLGLYFAEHNKGAFKNHFITFSMTPKLVEVKGKDIYEKVKYVTSFNEVANTNIQAVFDLILNTAVKNKLPQSELPETIYIISDMEFDYCVCSGNEKFTNYELAKKKFKKKGYTLPNVVFWNVAARTGQVPVTMHQSGTALVSGASPKIFDMVKSGDINPYAVMMEIIESERYAPITA